MTEQQTETPIVETATEARQGERKKGMPVVLAVSTLIAVVVLAIVLVSFAA